MDSPYLYLLMNKPSGVVCSAVSDSHQTVYQLLPPELQSLVQSPKRGHRLHTVGRLDCDTSGLLLFTTDGFFSHHLTSPDTHIEKTYKVTLLHPIPQAQWQSIQNQFQQGLLLPPEKKAPVQQSGPAQLQFLSSSECLVTITEGKFHQVRRMFLAIQNQVQTLHRQKIGSLSLEENLLPGCFRSLTSAEIQSLIK